MNSFTRTIAKLPGNPFHRGDRPGKGAPPRQPRSGTVLREPKFTGSGTLDDPKIYWLGDPTRMFTRPMILAINSIVADEAIHMGFRCVVVRMATHSTTFVLTATVNRLQTAASLRGARPPVQPSMPHTRGTTQSGAPTTQIDIDPHLTLYMGADWHRCQVDGHAFVLLDPATRVPLRKLAASERRLVEPGHEKVGAEYWHYPGH